LAGLVGAYFPGKNIILYFAFVEDISEHFSCYQQPLETRFGAILKGGTKIAPELLDEIFKDAMTLHASDVHFEPQEKEVIIRFRVDGVLREAGRLPKDAYENIINRIKVQAHLRIDAHFAAQDGAMRMTMDTGYADMRISIVPTLNGEKVCARLLSSYVRSFSLSDLGLSARHQTMLLEASRKPFGMILVTGPTGSGKSTTLYALLKMLNRSDVNVTTIEDPVEYRITGINQIQVNVDTNLTFAQGLRSIVRQDPNIILVGEIRDKETAEISVNAALTGHLLLSTFHANDASTAVPRLLEIGIEPFLLASTLELVIAQRLVRQICDGCRTSKSINKEDIGRLPLDVIPFFTEENITLYHGKGCAACHGSGYKGRIAIFEFISVTEEVEELMLTNPSGGQLWHLACAQGARSLFEDGIEKIKNGQTTIEELLRVAAPPKAQKKEMIPGGEKTTTIIGVGSEHQPRKGSEMTGNVGVREEDQLKQENKGMKAPGTTVVNNASAMIPTERVEKRKKSRMARKNIVPVPNNG
jgi:type IV pilus assembly protein PilB